MVGWLNGCIAEWLIVDWAFWAIFAQNATDSAKGKGTVPERGNTRFVSASLARIFADGLANRVLSKKCPKRKRRH
jgi:hypothetical protein